MITWRVSVVALACSCSFVGSRGPGALGPDDRPDCSGNPILPALDATVAVPPTVFAGYVLLTPADMHGDPPAAAFQLAVGLPVLAVAAAVASSAIYGFIVTSRCRDALDRYAKRHPTP